MKNSISLALIASSVALLSACGGSSGGGNGGGGGGTQTAIAEAIAAITPIGGDAACGGFGTQNGTFDHDSNAATAEQPLCQIGGTITEDVTLTNDTTWVLTDFVTVGLGNLEIQEANDVTLLQNNGFTFTVEAGTHVRAEDDAALVITRGSSIVANGTAAMPITFSGFSDTDFDGLGQWGGVVVQGFAPQYGAGNTGVCFGASTFCNVEGEGGSDIANYGGNIADDNSGTIRYVRIAEGGLVAGPNNEVNGLTLQGVGHATTVEFVQVHNNLDDGVEWFGGTVNAKYLVLTNNDDDDIDFDEGYQGNIQYAIVSKSSAMDPQGSNDPRGIEANSSDDELVSDTNAVLANITLIGNNVNNAGAGANDGEPGMRLRGALTVAVHNTLALNWNNGCIRIDDADDDGDAATAEVPSNVTLNNVLTDCARVFRPSDETAANTAAVTDLSGAGITFNANGFGGVTNAEATLAGPATITAFDNGSGFTFDQTAYVGAVDPAATSAWWAGWTIPGSVNLP